MDREEIRHLDEAVADIFAVMLALPCRPRFAAARPTPPCLSAAIHFNGALSGTCLLVLQPVAAAYLTATLMGLPTSQIDQALCADTAGELCNMVAGNWKTRLPIDQETCQLSCPQVYTYDRELPARVFIQRIQRVYEFSGHKFAIQLAWR